MTIKLSQLNLQFPIFEVSSDFDNITKYNSLEKLTLATKIAVDRKSMLQYYLFDGANQLYRIVDIIDLGLYRKKTFYDFIFGNPLHKIESVLEPVIDLEKFDLCKSLLKKLGDTDSYSKMHEE